jgi:radical SAM superfamily enzyme YgiQ (UPF0313 family)
MKILLIYPHFLEDRIHEEEISVPPLGIFYVAAVLKDSGYDVEVLNWHNIHRTPQKIKAVLQAKNPAIIGFSILHANRWGGIEIARIARELNPDVKIVFGGIGATYLWEHLLTHFAQIDYVVIGEGEYSFLDLVRCIEGGATADIHKISGIAYRKNGCAVRTACDGFVRDLDALPNPARYFAFQHVALTRGCPADCTFCGSPDFWGRKVRFHSADYFVDQLTHLYRKGITYFFFCDDTFTLNKKKVIAVCRKILKRKLDIVWQAISRVDMVSEEILYWMRRAGCIQISYGVESGSEKIRHYLNKDFTLQQIEKTFSLTTQYGIMSRAYFIYGCPGETAETIQETIALMRRIKPLSTIFYILDIFPGTALYNDYKSKNNASDDIWRHRIEDILYFETDPQLTPEKILAFGKKLRSAFYENLPAFVDALELVDNRELYPLHADFLSRLAMTFDHGDYAGIDAIRGKTRIAGDLYKKALAYHPDPRAYLGLGIHRQKAGQYADSIKILAEGSGHFPRHEQLNMCLGVSYMNLGEYQKALACFLPFQDGEKALRFMAGCYQAMSQPEKAEAVLRKIRSE